MDLIALDVTFLVAAFCVLFGLKWLGREDD